MTSKATLTTKAAITQVLAASKKPMTVSQIAEQAVPLTGLAGAELRADTR